MTVTLILAALLPAGAFALLLLVKSVIHYTRGGPRVPEDVMRRFSHYALWWLLILTLWTGLIALCLSGIGVLAYAALMWLLDRPAMFWPALLAGSLALAIGVFRQFCRILLFTPSTLTVSLQYRINRLYPLWQQLSPRRLQGFDALLSGTALLLFLASLLKLTWQGEWLMAVLVLTSVAAVIACFVQGFVRRPVQPVPRRGRKHPERPNVLLIGADTLRADRLSATGYPRTTTPCMDRLAQQGTLFSNCYVPLGRTAPSLASMLTGVWPHHHGVRENFTGDHGSVLPITSLPTLLAREGYHTVAVADWSGADLGKFNFGYQDCLLPDDQWNLKYYLSQGPMDLRLFLTLFTQSEWGRRCLPQLYYLAGVPLTAELGDQTLAALNRMAEREQPFLMTIFMGTTHVPFGSEYPWYLRYSSADYSGDSKFVVSRLADPMEIIEMQEAERSRFDVPQILNLYDACVARFDAELERVLQHLRACDLADDTIVVVFSDHGCDFFENHTWGQGNTVIGSDPSARVPLLIVDPRQPGVGTVDRIVRNIDVVPTLLDILGLKADQALDGVSLTPYLRNPKVDLGLAAYQETGVWLGRIPGRHPEHLVYPNVLEILEVPDAITGTLAFKPEYADVIIEARDRMIRTEDWKLVYLPLKVGAIWQLFDMRRDPGCQTDVAALHPGVFAELKATLIAWIAQDQTREFVADHFVPRTSSLI